MLDTYKYFRPIAILAGILGIVQSLAWMGMVITGISAYYCNFNIGSILQSIGSLFELTFYRLYFQGNCFRSVIPNFTVLDRLATVKPMAVHAWMWVYLVLSFGWLISSVTLITNVRMKYIRHANVFLYIWILVTLVISILDLALGIMFGLDFSEILAEAYNVAYQTAGVNDAILITGSMSAFTMLIVSMRGFILWIINVVLIVYFFTETINIFDYNKIKVHVVMNGKRDSFQSGISNGAFVSEANPSYGRPIDAYGYQTNWTNLPTLTRSDRPRMAGATPYRGDAEPHHRPVPPPPATTFSGMGGPSGAEPPQDIVAMRRDAAASVAREIIDRNSYSVSARGFSGQPYPQNPQPDYSPPMPRANNPYGNRAAPLRSALRNPK